MQYNMILYCGFYCVSKNLITKSQMSPALREGGFHIRLSAGVIIPPAESLRSKAPCDGCNRRSVIKRAYHALLRFKKT